MRLEECIFDRNTPVAAPTLLAATPNATEPALFYSDSSSPKVCEVNSSAWGLEADAKGQAPQVECVYRDAHNLAGAHEQAPASSFLSAKSPWLVAVMKVWKF